jgi:hypothetical protein
MRILSLLLLLPSLLSAQEKKSQKGYFSLEIGTYFNKDPAVGLHLNGNGALGKGFYAGMELRVVTFQDMDGVYIPILAKFTIIPNQNLKKVSPIAVFEPGYGLYNKTRVGPYSPAVRGGINFFGGAGLTFPETGRGRSFLMIGYSLFGFKMDDVTANVETFGVRAGFMLR